MNESLILKERNYNFSRDDLNKIKINTKYNNSIFKNNKTKLFNAYTKLTKEVKQHFKKEKERFFFP